MGLEPITHTNSTLCVVWDTNRESSRNYATLIYFVFVQQIECSENVFLHIIFVTEPEYICSSF